MRLMALLGALLLLLCTTPAAAQLAGYRIVGTSCTTGRISKGIGAVPFSVRGVPRIGSSFTVVTEGTASYPWGTRRRVFVITGVSNTSAGGVRLPFDVSKLFPGQPYCGLLRTSIELMSPVPVVKDYRSTAGVTFSVPNQRALAGVKFYQQAMSLEYSAFGPPFRSGALSAGGDGTVGF